MAASTTEATTRSLKSPAGIVAPAGAAALSRSSTPSRSPTLRHAAPETVWARMRVSCPAP